MRALVAVVGASLVVSACSGGDAGNSEANMDMNAGMTDTNSGMTDTNAGMTDMNAMMDANMSENAADGTNATVANDLTANSPDANLVNGM